MVFLLGIFLAEVSWPRMGNIHAEEKINPMEGYAEYRGETLGILVRCQYPEGWTIQEERGQREPYLQVRFRGPRNPDQTYTAYISVRESPLAAYGGKFEGVDAAVDFFLSHLLSDARVKAKTQKLIGGIQAIDLSVAYTIPPLRRPTLRAQPIPVVTRSLFVEKSPYLYELIYSADEQEFPRYLPSFEHLLETVSW